MSLLLILGAAVMLPPPDVGQDVVDAAAGYTQCLGDALAERAPDGPPVAVAARSRLVADLRRQCAPARAQATRDAEAEAARDGAIPDARQRALAVRLLLDQQDADFRADVMTGSDTADPMEAE